ncbi:hypothetical protein Asppvi_007058 [Aspergillus pseudoviridinutans]|uniref:Xylanolytic transcriptional activator regulatory domain-containing protein n=1 Tax=Aspergillus pseudoviridinutans TaxID=1517512 RepID=A0A9P3BB79_9EURO|nr:uncharacterized protein Asppvi_007058 [Aspergillus pseudoviridinutans]GIJ88141.1 hypothetical protein Asppvi_007058 [Aspergillus pseudoviridinutans]
MADMASRVASLEKSVAQARQARSSAINATIAETSTDVPSAPPAAFDANSGNDRSPEDIIVQKGSSTQYFNESLLSGIMKQEHNIKNILTPPLTGSLPAPASSPYNAQGILSAPILSVPPASLHPPQQLAIRLWNLFVESVEVKVYSTIDNPSTAPLENLALCFAIYFASTSSLDTPNPQITLEQDSHALLLRFKLGLEQTLAHGDFLDHPTVTGLQALAIYLAALRVQNRGKGMWILNGLAIRIAQSLGLHRDGERLGLSPFQSEMRRRLWWHLVTRDSRGGEDYGLESTNSLLMGSDVDLPRNLDDTDLHPELQSLPPAKNYWTPMTFSLINIDLTRTMQKLAVLAASSSPSCPPNEAERAQIFKETRERIDKWLRFCNPIIPLQNLTLSCSQFLLRKRDFVTKLQWILLQPSRPQADFATEENLIEALEILEPRLSLEHGLLSQFTWIEKAYPQYHVAMYILWHLCVRPEGPNIDRAWRAVDAVFSQETADSTSFRSGSNSTILVALRAKAISVKEKARKRKDNGSVSTANRSSERPSEEYQSVFAGPSPCLPGDALADEPGLDFSNAEWPDWSAVVQDYQFDLPNFFWH